MTSRRHLLAGLCALFACTSPLDLPASPSAAPVIGAIRPLRAYYFDEVRLTGSGFDPAPDANLVLFAPDVVARGTVDPDTGELVVRVPYSTSAIEGPLEVETRAGRSQPSRESFLSLGVGYPHVGSVLTEVPVRHDPRGLGGTDEDLVFPSAALRLLVHGVDGKVRLPGLPLGFAASPDAARFLVGYPAATSEGLSLVERDGWRVAARAPKSRFSERFVTFAEASGDLVFAAGEDASDDAWLASYRREGSALVRQERPLAVDRVLGLAAAPDGRHALLVVRAPGPRGLTTGVLWVEPGTDAAPEWLPAPDGPALAGPAALAVADEAALVCARDDGSLVTLVLGASRAWAPRVLGSGQRTAPASLLSVGGLVVASHRAAGTVTAVDPSDGRVAWTAAVRGAPEALGRDTAGARVFVGNGATNDIEVLDAVTGAWRERRAYPIELGSDEACRCGPVAPFRYVGAGRYSRAPRMLFTASRWDTLVVLEPNKFILEAPVPLAEGASRALGLVAGPDDTAWVLHERELGVVEDGWERLVVRDLPAVPQQLLFAQGRLVVGSARRVDVYAPEGDGWRREGALLRPGSELVAALSVQPDGRVAVLWYGLDADGEELQGGLYTAGALAAGGAPDVTFGPASWPPGFLGLVEMKRGTLLLFREGGDGGGPVSRPLVSSGAQDVLASVIDALEPLLVTPNGQLVAWEDRLSGDHVLRMASLWDLDGWNAYGEYRLPGPFSRPAIDPTGEWLYVPLVGDDRILILN